MPKAATTPLRLQSTNNELDGTLRFYLSRFLHVELNLALQEGRRESGAKPYQLAEHRRVRPQEIHSFRSPQARGAGAGHTGGKAGNGTAGEKT